MRTTGGGLKPAPLLAIVALAAGLDGAEQQGRVSAAGLPIPGAVVTAVTGDRKVITSTDESGAYVLEGLTPGSWTIEVDVFGFEKATRVISVPAEAVVGWDLKLRLATRAAPGALAAPQRLGLNQTVGSELLAEVSAPLPDTQQLELAQNANESFLVTGSLSRGLQLPREEGMPFFPGVFGPPGTVGLSEGGANPPGLGGPAGEAAGGAPGLEAGRGPGRPSPGGAPGSGPGMGPGRGPGGFGAEGFGGPGGFGGRAGPGGLGGPGASRRPGAAGERGGTSGARPQWQGRPGTMLFGNRANRGRESFRGMAFFTLRNSALDARPYSLTGQTVEKPSYAQARCGLAGGGQLRIPKLIQSDRAFVFLNYFGTRSRNPFNAVSTLPTAAERTGDFSQSVARGPVVIYDPLTRSPFAGNQVPAARINPAASGLISFFPLPNQPGRVQNYQFITSTPQNTDNLGVRMFHSLSRQNRIGGSFNLQSRGSETAQLYGFRDTQRGRGLSLDLTWMRTLRPGLISNARFHFSRNRSETVPFFAYGRNVAAELGITGVSNDPVNYGPPNLSFTNFGGLTDASAALRRVRFSGEQRSGPQQSERCSLVRLSAER